MAEHSLDICSLSFEKGSKSFVGLSYSSQAGCVLNFMTPNRQTNSINIYTMRSLGFLTFLVLLGHEPQSLLGVRAVVVVVEWKSRKELGKQSLRLVLALY